MRRLWLQIPLILLARVADGLLGTAARRPAWCSSSTPDAAILARRVRFSRVLATECNARGSGRRKCSPLSERAAILDGLGMRWEPEGIRGKLVLARQGCPSGEQSEFVPRCGHTSATTWLAPGDYCGGSDADRPGLSRKGLGPSSLEDFERRSLLSPERLEHTRNTQAPSSPLRSTWTDTDTNRNTPVQEAWTGVFR